MKSSVLFLFLILFFTSTLFAQSSGKADSLQKQLLTEMISEPAAAFSLQDLDGKTVSFKDLKGKVIVLDFWSTWCVPCKKSFPAMQLAMNKYKNDPGVKFLFIHTWETGKSPAEDVKKYLQQSGFNFQVLMDLKNETGHNLMVESYQVTSIPAKFIIDKKGNIVFKLTGFSGTDQAAVDELSTRIELAKTK